MSLWVDKYKPKTIDQLTYHNDLSKRLKKLANSDNLPHMLFYGPPGAGKKTRIAAILREVYGPAVEKIKVEPRQFVTSSNRKMNFSVVSSNFHMELNPSDLGMYDRVIVQDVIKGIAQTQQIDANARHQFKIVVIDKADELTREAQAALRRTMEKYTSSMRLILCCNTLSKIIPPVRSRCLLIRVPRPEIEETVGALLNVASKENFQLSKQLAADIAEHSERNMRASLLALETTATQRHDQSPNTLVAIRPHLYELITKNIESNTILKKLTFILLNKVDSSLKPKIVEKAAYHEHRMRIGAKQIIHLEAFMSSVMCIYKRFLTGI
ncbi:hypothetical protein G6F43_000639 [Rhizopus delemar]|nr:hypothetical protein G6F43_000639 [Rhizopus delemar]